MHPGAVVIEHSFAGTLGVHPGDRITRNGKPFTVAGGPAPAGLMSQESS